MKYRLKVYSPFGPARGFLTLPLQAEVVTELNEVSTLTLSYNKNIDNSSVTNYLNGDVEIGVEYYDGEWIEPDNHRFMLINEKNDVVSDTPVNNYNFLGLENLFKKVPIYQAGISDSEGNILFSGMNPGEILKLIIDTAQDKGFIPGLTYDFSATRDSDNKTWLSKSTVSYPRTSMLSDVIQDLTESGIFDYTLEGRQLRVFNPETALARDRNSVTLFNAFSSSAPTETSYADRLTHMRVIGDNGNEWLFNNNTTSPWGKLEIVSSQSGIPDQPTAYEMSGADLLRGKAPRKTYTKEFEGVPEKEYPFLDYQLGDWVTVQIPDGTFESQRIQTLSITVGGDSEFKWFVSVGDKTEDQISKITKKIRGLSSSATGGSTTRPGGSGSAPSGEFRTPTRPLGFIANPITRADSNGGWAGYISATWNDDGKAAGPGEFAGTNQPRDRYEIQWWVVGSSSNEAFTYTASPDVRNITINNVPITDSKGNEISYSLRMRTWGGNSTRSSWTPTVTINMIKDTVPPPVPTDPIVKNEPKQIIPTAAWDGKFVGNADKPDDFNRTELQMRKVQEDFDEPGTDYSWSQQTYSSQEFEYLLADTIPGRTYQVRLGAYDTVENFSGWSNHVEFKAQEVVDREAIEAVLEEAQDRIDEAREWADQRFAEFGVRATEAEQAIAQAESDLAAVQALLDTMPEPADLETAIQQVQEAIETIGDLPQRLADAEDLIQSKADSSLVNQLEGQMSQLDQDLTAAEGRISSAEDELSSAQSELSGLDSRLTDAQIVIDSKASSQELADLNTTLTQSFTSGINAAKQEAATDAQNKANAAKTAAENAAKAHADLVASNASADAIAAAAADATAKANAAKTAAENAAKAYADAQRVAAVNEAAQNAQEEYDRLQAAAEEALQAAVTAAGNLWPDPSFEMGGKGIVSSANWEIVEDSRARHGTHVLRLISNATVYQRDHLPAENDDYLHCEAWVYRTSTNQTGTVQLRPQRIAVDGTTGSYSTPAFDLANAPVGEWTKVSGIVRLTNNTRAISGARLYLQVNGDVAGLLIDSVKYVNVNAAQEALSAAQAAQSRADAAHSLAGTAEANAQLAMTAAGQKTRVHYSTSAPSGTASEGDVWRRIDSNGDVYGEWVRVGNSWQSRGIRNEMISNLDVGKLTAGTASIGTAVANKLFADIFAANKITAGELSVTSSGNMVTDELFETLSNDSNKGGWSLNGVTRDRVNVRDSASGLRVLEFNTGGSLDTPVGTTMNVDFPRQKWRVQPGDKFYVSVRVYLNQAGLNALDAFRVWMPIHDANGGYVHAAIGAFTNINNLRQGWQDLGFEMTIRDEIPLESYSFLQFRVQYKSDTGSGAQVLFGNPLVRRMVGATVIEPGAITTEKMTITGEMAAALVNADKGNFISLIAQDLIADNATLINAAMSSLTVTEKAKFASAFAETLWTNELVAKVLEASRATVASGNMAPTMLDEAGWDLSGTASFTNTTQSATGRAIRMTPTGTTSWSGQARSTAFDVVPGDTIKMSTKIGRIGGTLAAGGRWYLGIESLNSSTDARIGDNWALSFQTDAANWGTVVEGTVTIPEGITRGRIRLMLSGDNSNGSGLASNAHTTFYDMRVTSMTDGSLIVENSITAKEINVTDTLRTNILGADTVVSDILVANNRLWARSANIIAAEMGNLTVTQKANFADAFADSFMSNSAVITELLTSRLVVSAENFAPDPGLVPEAWRFIGADVVSNSNSATGNAIRLAQRSGDTQVRGPMRPVRPGETIRFQGYYLRSGSGSDVGTNVQLRMEWFKDPKGSRTSQTTFHTIASTMWSHTTEAEVVVPSGVTWGRLYIYQTSTTGPSVAQFYGDMDVRPKLGGQLIVPGTITAEHIVASESLTAKFAQFLTVETDMLAANAVTSGKIRAGAINGMTITGAVIQTTSTSNRGILLNSSFLRAWDSSGNLKFELNASSGELTATGLIRTNFSGDRVEIRDDGAGGRIQFHRGNERGRLKMSENYNRLEMVYSDTGASDTRPYIGVEESRAMIGFQQSRFIAEGTTQANQALRIEGTIKGNVTYGDYIVMEQGARIQYRDNLNRSLATVGQSPGAGDSSMFQIWLERGSLNVVNGGLQIPENYKTTSSVSANVYISSSGWLSRATSASKYKLDKKPLEVMDSVLDVPMMDWIDKAQSELKSKMDEMPRPFTEQDQITYNTAAPLRRYPGVIAEDVVKYGGEDFVVYGEDGDLEEVMYDRLAIAQIQVLKRKNEDLENRIKLLEEALS